MSCSYQKKVCFHCKQTTEVLEFDKNFSSKLEEFMDYASIEIHQCEHCGFVSFDLEKPVAETDKQIIVSKEYLDALNCECFDEVLKIIDKEESYVDIFPFNFCDAFVLLAKDSNKDLTFRAMFRSFSYKCAIHKKIERERLTDFPDLEDKEIKALDSAIKLCKQIAKKDFEKIVEFYETLEKTPMQTLLLAFGYKKLNQFTKCESLIKDMPEEYAEVVVFLEK